jgi:hypothetical protein
MLVCEITMEDILEESKRSPRRSSPGSDGLPYKILNLIYRFPPLQPLITTVYNTALKDGTFPTSWNESLMTLLFKKGDPKDIRNYRPLSLVNTDYKIFTRIVNRRIMCFANDLVNDAQLGFIPRRYIAENALTTQLIMEDAHLQRLESEKLNSDSPKDIALLLDQEKADDRVNVDYLKQVLIRFGLPDSMVNCLYNLLVNNNIRININGFFSDNVNKKRGLKQGDPISCILYNLFFELFLRSILLDDNIDGCDFKLKETVPAANHISQSKRTKILCYADDALVFFHSPNDLIRLQSHLTTFSSASNAKINYSKVEAISLSGENLWNY